MCYTPDISGLLNLKKCIPCEVKLGSKSKLQLMLHMSVCCVTKLYICSMYSQLVAVNIGRSIVFLSHVNFEGHVSKMTCYINR